jgi:hypothetical protein
MVDDEDEPFFAEAPEVQHIEPKMGDAWARPKAGKKPRPGSVRWFRVMAATHSTNAFDAGKKIEPEK